MNPTGTPAEDSGSGRGSARSGSARVSTRSGPPGSVHPRVENPESLLRVTPGTGQNPTNTEGTAPGAVPALAGRAGTEHRSQWALNTLWPRMQTWLEEALLKEVPRHVEGVTNRTVPPLVDERARAVVTPVIDVVVSALVERELRAALDPGDHLTPVGLSLQTAINVAVEARLAEFNPNGTVVEAPQPPTTAAVPINLLRTGTEDTRPRQVRMAPHPKAGPRPED